jgi:hypothetical protein
MIASMLRRAMPAALITLGALAPCSSAQSPFDIGARVAPQFYSYKIGSPSNMTISEFAFPIFVQIPVTQRLTFDVGTSFAQARVEETGTTKTVSTISGLTDTQIRGNLSLGTDFVILTAAVNLPTGRSTVGLDQQRAAGLIGSDFLSFPISNMGTGFGGTGGVVVARPVGEWNMGFGLSVRHSAQYDPFDATGGQALHYQPGNEYRARVGVDHPVGTGRVTLGVTYSTFGNDELAGSIYNTGNRYFSQIDFNNSLGAGRLSLSAWNLFRTRGTLADSSLLDHENISNGAVAYGIPVGSIVLEPNVEGRAWMQVGAATSYLGTFGVRLQIPAGGMSIVPSAGFSVGQIAAQTPTSVGTTASLTGFRGALAIRLR